MCYKEEIDPSVTFLGEPTLRYTAHTNLLILKQSYGHVIVIDTRTWRSVVRTVKMTYKTDSKWDHVCVTVHSIQLYTQALWLVSFTVKLSNLFYRLFRVFDYQDGWVFSCISTALRNQTLPYFGAIKVAQLQDSFKTQYWSRRNFTIIDS